MESSWGNSKASLHAPSKNICPEEHRRTGAMAKAGAKFSGDDSSLIANSFSNAILYAPAAYASPGGQRFWGTMKSSNTIGTSRCGLVNNFSVVNSVVVDTFLDCVLLSEKSFLL